jgi:dTDP-L-rhamnose 4-epimerase
MSRIVVTGGGGFIGRYLARELLGAGNEVVVYDALLEQVHEQGEADLPEGAEFVRGDVRDAERLRQALSRADAVVHLAAEVGVGQSMYEIARYVGANDLGTAVLLETLIDTPVERIVLASSMSVYGEGLYETAGGQRIEDARRRTEDLARGQWEPMHGGEPLIPCPTDETKRESLASIYALTKYAQERAVLIWGEAYGRRATALRLFNVFGAGQALGNPYTGVLANFASRLAGGQRPMVFEDGEQRRDFVHVEDVARAFRLALESDNVASEVLNVGSGQSYTIATVARLLAEAMGKENAEPEILGKMRKGDIRNCFADISKARRLLGFEPAFRLETSLEPFVAWVQSAPSVDRGAEMRRELETRGLVA